MEQESTMRKIGRGLMKGLMWGAVIGGLLALGGGLPFVGPAIGAINTIIASVGSAAGGLLASVLPEASTVALANAFPAVVVGTKVAATTLVAGAALAGAAIGGVNEVVNKPSNAQSAGELSEVNQLRTQVAMLGTVAQQQQQFIESAVAQSGQVQTLAGQTLVRGAHCQAEDARRASMGISGPNV